tara:strand:+ start:1079 stop:1813 length:735 start_codon:yes stop_codon:yes gene_type:complete
MPGIGFRPLGYYGGGMVPKKYANGNLVEGDSTMYGAEGPPPVEILPTFQEMLNQPTQNQDRKILRDMYNVPPTMGGMTGTEADRLPNPVSFGEMVFQELNPGGSGVDGGVAQHYFEQYGEYPEGYQPTGPSGAMMPNAIEQQFIAIEDSPEQVSPQQLYEFLARPEVQAALRNSQSSFIRERYEAYMSQLGGSGPITDSELQGVPAQLPTMPATGAGAVGSTMDIAPLFNRGGGNPAGPFGEQY